MLANGFLSHRANDELRRRVAPPGSRQPGAAVPHEEDDSSQEAEHITADRLYRQLLILVYRFLFLLVSEDRGLLSADPLYREHYGVARLRRMLEARAAFTEHDDLWQSLRACGCS